MQLYVQPRLAKLAMAKILITSLENVIRIRTGEAGDHAMEQQQCSVPEYISS